MRNKSNITVRKISDTIRCLNYVCKNTVKIIKTDGKISLSEFVFTIL